jgi:hypothetical protein
MRQDMKHVTGIARFEFCSAFIRVMACKLAHSLMEPFPRVLQSKSLPS